MAMAMDKIQQQIYTRAKRSLFQQSEGYGTIAKTNCLNEAFIKDNIHPYCVYPTGCTQKVITLVNFPCGRMLFGQITYVAKDFTGQRATFFAHNYILPPKIAGEAVRNIEKLRNVKFLTEYTSEEPLEELDTLPCEPKPAPQSPQPHHPVLDTGTPPLILFPNKTYIPANFTWQLLSSIYSTLSNETKQQLGFCSYATQPVNKKGLHIIFVPPEAYNPSKFVNSQQKTTISPQQFFQNTEFLQTRIPGRDHLPQTLEWLDANLDTLTLSQFLAVPGQFIQNGKTSLNPDLFIMLSILKTCATAIASRKPFD